MIIHNQQPINDYPELIDYLNRNLSELSDDKRTKIIEHLQQYYGLMSLRCGRAADAVDGLRREIDLMERRKIDEWMKEGRVRSSQTTARTCIDVMNHYLTSCPISGKLFVTSDPEHSIEFSMGGHLIFKSQPCKNMQGCYEELIEFIINKALCPTT